MQETKLSDILAICVQNNLPFYSFRMPQSHEVKTGIQITSELHNFSDFSQLSDGFVIAPFDANSKTDSLHIRADVSFLNNQIQNEDLATLHAISFKAEKSNSTSREISKDEYLRQASLLIDKLQKKELQKVVLSRTIQVTDITIDNAVTIFDNLTHNYPNTFVSIFFIPGKYCWIGATPETLLKAHSIKVETMSLAGTKPIEPNARWSEKEREEQQMVSDYVASVLQKFPFKEINVEGPLDFIAGNVCHLMTKYDCIGNMNSKTLFDLVTKLHPTPAVCGLPKEQSMQLIHQTELHDREYYAGYMGPVSAIGCDLFVNLRCMKLTDNDITLYVGGGITAQSVAEAEWQETCLKAETLLKIIKKE